MFKSRILSIANMYFNNICENIILPKISESTVQSVSFIWIMTTFADLGSQFLFGLILYV